MGMTVKINAVDRTEYVDAKTLSINDEITSKVNTASFDFICQDVALAPATGETVLIEENSTKLFSGRVLSKDESFLPPNLLRYSVECIDHTRDLDRMLVAETYVDMLAGDIIKDVIAKYTTGFTYNHVSDGPTIGGITFDYVQVSEVITKIAEICGYEWYVDYDKDVYFFFREDYPAPFQLDDNQTDYKDLVIDTDISQIRNRVYVKTSSIKDTFGEIFIGDGVTTSWTCKYKAEIMLPTALDTDVLRWRGNAIEFSNSDIYLAVGLDWVFTMPQCPNLRIFKRNGDIFTKIDNPDIWPGGNAYGVAWSSDDVYLAVGHDHSPCITIYKRDEDVFTKLDNPATLPAGYGKGLDFGYNDTYLAIAHEDTPYITIYKRAEDVFTKLTNPGTLPTGTGYDAAFSPDGTYLAVVHATSPYITIYKRAGDVFTKLDNPADLPVGDAYDVAFSPDGVYLAVGHKSSPYITIYKRSEDVFTKLANPTDLPAGYVMGVAFAPNSTHLATAHDKSPYITLYKRGGDTFVKMDNPSPLPTGDGLSVAFSYRNRYMAVGYKKSPRLTIYKHYVPLIKVDGVYKSVGWTGIDNPAYFDFMLDADTKVLSLGTASIPADGVELFVIYNVLGAPICFRRDDKDSIADRIEKEGGDGIIEFCIVDNNINNLDWANEATKADLLENAYPVIRGTFETNRSDIHSGQVITLNSTKRDINQQFILQKVELVRVDTSGESIVYAYQVTIANKFKKLEDLFLHLLDKTDISLLKGAETPPAAAIPPPPESVPPPATPTGLALFTGMGEATQAGLAWLKATWNANTEDEYFSYYELKYKRTDYSDFGYVGTTDTSYLWTGLDQGVEYEVYIRAVDIYGNRSAWSSQVTIVTDIDESIPGPVTNATAIAILAGIKITWTGATGSNIAGYIIEGQESPDNIDWTGEWTEKVRLNAYMWFDLFLDYTKYYRYRIRAYSQTEIEGETSDPSNAVQPEQVTTPDIEDWAVTATQIAQDAVTSIKIAANAITPEKIQAEAVESTKLAANAVTEGKIATNAVTENKINANAVVADKIAANAVTTEKLNALAITAGKIAASAITTTKLDALAITAEKIAANAIVADKIYAGSVGTDKLAALAITTDKIKASAITTAKIEAGAVTADLIAAKTITASEIYGTKLSTIFANLGTITAGNITLNSSGFIRTYGKDSYTDNTAGFWLGYSAGYKLNIGNVTNYLKWSGSSLYVHGKLYVGGGTDEDIYFEDSSVRMYDYYGGIGAGYRGIALKYSTQMFWHVSYNGVNAYSYWYANATNYFRISVNSLSNYTDLQSRVGTYGSQLRLWPAGGNNTIIFYGTGQLTLGTTVDAPTSNNYAGQIMAKEGGASDLLHVRVADGWNYIQSSIGW